MTDNMIAGYIAQNLRQLRQSRNLTQEQLARLSGVPRPPGPTWNLAPPIRRLRCWPKWPPRYRSRWKS